MKLQNTERIKTDVGDRARAEKSFYFNTWLRNSGGKILYGGQLGGVVFNVKLVRKISEKLEIKPFILFDSFVYSDMDFPHWTIDIKTNLKKGINILV